MRIIRSIMKFIFINYIFDVLEINIFLYNLVKLRLLNLEQSKILYISESRDYSNTYGDSTIISHLIPLLLYLDDFINQFSWKWTFPTCGGAERKSTHKFY